MGESAVWTVREVAIVAFTLWVFVDVLVVFRRKTGTAQNRDRASLKLMMIIGMISWPLAILLAYLSFGRIHHTESIQYIGLIAFCMGVILRSLAIWQLGRFHTPNVAILDDHKLIENGIYRFVRHPSYLGAIIAFVGFGFALGSWLSIVVVSAAAAISYLFRIHEEEAALGLALGEKYHAYCKRTKKLIPWVY